MQFCRFLSLTFFHASQEESFLIYAGCIALGPFLRLDELSAPIDAIVRLLMPYPFQCIFANRLLKNDVFTCCAKPIHLTWPFSDQCLMAHLNCRLNTLAGISCEQTGFHEDIHRLLHQTRLLWINKNEFCECCPAACRVLFCDSGIN